jgi:hypothetical protein
MSVILVRQEYGGRSRPYVMRTSNSGGGHLLHYFCTIVVLLGFSVVFAALAGVQAYLAAHDYRTPLVNEYNAAVHAWVTGGRDAFTNLTDGFAWAVDKAPLGALARVDGSCGDGKTVPASSTPPRLGHVALGTHDDGHDLARYDTTSVLYGVKLAYIPADDEGPGLTPVDVEIGRVDAKTNAVDSYTAFSTSFTPYECEVLSVASGGGGESRNTRNGGTWSPDVEPPVRCDACPRDETAIEPACDPRCRSTSGRGFVASRRWVRRVVLTRSQVTDGKVAGIARKPTRGTCSLMHGVERTTHHDSVWDARLACANDRSPLQDVNLEVEVRSPDDPHVLAGTLTDCTFRFGRNVDENMVSSAFFTLAAFVCLGLATYCVKRRKGFERYDSRLTQFSGWNAWRTPVTAMDFASREGNRRRSRAEAEVLAEQSCDDETDHEGDHEDGGVRVEEDGTEETNSDTDEPVGSARV